MLPLRTDQRRSAWAAIVSLLPLVLLFAAACYFAWNGWSADEGHPVDRAFAAIAGLLELFALARKPPISVPFFDLTIAGLLVVFALALFALMIVVALAPRLTTWWAGRTDAAPAPPLDDGVADTDGDPRAEPDPRKAIIRAYGRFERALAAARAPRRPCQTPREFMRTTLAQVLVPVSPVARLTALFETARFSDRPIGTDARDAACESLDEITRALEERR
jgi:hypothetical protein